MIACRCLIPVSHGELVDKITILEIKANYASGLALDHVIEELSHLRQALAGLAMPLDLDSLIVLQQELKAVNQVLWEIEDRLRRMEHGRQFDDEFIQLARQVYRYNDKRAAIKRRVNQYFGSAIWEEKIYSCV